MSPASFSFVFIVILAKGAGQRAGFSFHSFHTFGCLECRSELVSQQALGRGEGTLRPSRQPLFLSCLCFLTDHELSEGGDWACSPPAPAPRVGWHLVCAQKMSPVGLPTGRPRWDTLDGPSSEFMLHFTSCSHRNGALHVSVSSSPTQGRPQLYAHQFSKASQGAS